MNAFPHDSVIALPDGGVMYRCNDNAAAKACALRLGMYPHLTESLRRQTGRRSSACITYEEDEVIAVIVWEGFEEERQNGWTALMLPGVSVKNHLLMEVLIRTVTGATEPALCAEAIDHN